MGRSKGRTMRRGTLMGPGGQAGVSALGPPGAHVSQEDVPEECGSVVRCSVVPLPSCVTLGKLLSLSEPQFPNRQNGPRGVRGCMHIRCRVCSGCVGGPGGRCDGRGVGPDVWGPGRRGTGPERAPSWRQSGWTLGGFKEVWDGLPDESWVLGSG